MYSGNSWRMAWLLLLPAVNYVKGLWSSWREGQGAWCFVFPHFLVLVALLVRFGCMFVSGVCPAWLVDILTSHSVG